MRVNSIGACPAMSYRGGKASITAQEAEVIQAAKKELEMIKVQGQKAGTDAAWWRYGFGEAKAVLESIANNEYLPTTQRSNLMSFHDSDDDGFI